MTTQKQTVGIPLLGLNTMADQKSAAAGEFDLVENMWFNRTARGGAELRKRYGGASLTLLTTTAATLNSGRRLGTFGDERLMMGAVTSAASDPGSMLSYSPQLARWKYAERVANGGQASAPSIGVTAQGVAANPTGFLSPDCAVNPGGTLMCITWVDQGLGAATFVGSYAIIDLVTGQTLVYASLGVTDGKVGTAAGWHRVIALASAFVLINGNVTDNTIKARLAPYSTLTLGAVTTLANNLNVTGKADVIKHPTLDEFLVAHQRSGTNDLIVRDFTNALAANGTNTSGEIPSQAIGWLNWDASNTRLYLVIVSAATGAKMIEFNSSTLGIVSTTLMDATVTSAAAATGYVTAGPTFMAFVEVRAAATYDCQIRQWPGGAGMFGYARSVGLAGACFKVASTGRYYLPVTYESSLQSAYYLFDVTFVANNFAPFNEAKALYGLGGGLSVAGCIGAVGAISSTVMCMGALRLVQNPGGQKFFAISQLRFDFAAASVSQPRRLGENAHVSGGCTRAYDAVGNPELGFHVFPELPTLVQGAAGGLTLLGAYSWAVVYIWQDSRGQFHRSAPSPIASTTLTGANATVTLTIPTLRLSQKDGTNPIALVYIEVYRTVAGGTTFYRVNATGAPLISDQGVNTVSYIDAAADATVSANEFIYTTGKVLPHIGPPSARLMETWRNRLFLAGTENPLELWVSNEYTPGEGVSFSDTLVLALEADGGPITALCEMDDRLVIFKRSAIYVIAGDGPTLTGDNQYHAPTRLTSIVGAVDQRGVVRTRDGVMFKSTRGIYLLAHTGAIAYVGAGVDTYNSLTVTGACSLDDDEQVRFVTSEGRTLVYHYGFADEQGVGRWTTFTNQPAVDCIAWNGKFVFIKSDGTVVEETVGAYTDPGGTSIAAKVRLCWLNLTQFFGRFKLYGLHMLGDLLATFTLTHRIAYDYDATVAETETKAVTVATPVPLQLDPARRRAVAAQVTLEETSTTQGFQLSGWGLEVGVQPGAAKAGAEKKLT